MSDNPYREVSRDEFYKFILGLKVNVHPFLEGSYPYTSVFCKVGSYGERGVEYGKIVSSYETEGVLWPIKTVYLLKNR